MTGTLDFLRGAISGSTITREGGPRDCLRELLEVEKRGLEAIYTIQGSRESGSGPLAKHNLPEVLTIRPCSRFWFSRQK